MHLSTLQVKVKSTKDSLEASNQLSEVINSGVNSLEIRKQRATLAANSFDDICQLRSLIIQVRDSLRGGSTDIEGATVGMARALAVIKALD